MTFFKCRNFFLMFLYAGSFVLMFFSVSDIYLYFLIFTPNHEHEDIHVIHTTTLFEHCKFSQTFKRNTQFIHLA